LRNWLIGDLLEAEADSRAALGSVSAVARTGGAVVLGVTRALIDRGELEDAARVVENAIGTNGARLARAGGQLALAQVRAAQGRWAEAAEAALEIGRLYPRAAGGHLTGIPWRTEAAVALAMTGDRDTARRLIAEQWPLTRIWDLPRQTGWVLRAEGIVEDSIELLREAVAVFETSPAKLELARTLGLLGAALRRANQRAEARDVLRRALDLADRCGAVRVAAAAAEELAATGARPRSYRLDGVESLTASELRIARMAAEGMSNPEIAQALFVTRKTVETHLGHAYRKLDVNRREDLAPVLAG
jgi:DNA-binding CsgD family transcriptional regulator